MPRRLEPGAFSELLLGKPSDKPEVTQQRRKRVRRFCRHVTDCPPQDTALSDNATAYCVRLACAARVAQTLHRGHHDKQHDSRALLGSAHSGAMEAEVIRTTERERLRALVAKDMEVARQLHAEDFELVNPGGVTFSKDQYLGAVASGELDYVVCELDSPMQVRVHADCAVIRYRSKLEVIFHEQAFPRRGFWHTDFYEKRAGQWQAVWSHATRIQEPDELASRPRAGSACMLPAECTE